MRTGCPGSGRYVILSRDMNAPAVIACSALKETYRDMLEERRRRYTVYLSRGQRGIDKGQVKGRERGISREHRSSKVSSSALEEPENVLTEDISQDPESIAEDIIRKLELKSMA